MPGNNSETNHEISTIRLEAFSDGVFAIAITLLILQLKIPDKSFGEQRLQNYLFKLWPNLAAYVFSFLRIGIYWANHHYIFKFYVKTDHTFLLLNLFFLMSICFLPFPTAILGNYISVLSHRQTSVSFYSIALFIPAFFWWLIWLYASHKGRLIDERLDAGFVKYVTRLKLFSTFLYLTSVVISFFYPVISILISMILTISYLMPPKKPQYRDA